MLTEVAPLVPEYPRSSCLLTLKQRQTLMTLQETYASEGIPMSVAELSRKFHVSAQAVRERCLTLLSVGLVHRVRGFYVPAGMRVIRG